jgi:Peptidase family M48
MPAASPLAALRYTHDQPATATVPPNEAAAQQAAAAVRRDLLGRAVRLAPEFFPDLAELVDHVARQLLGPRHGVEAFVTPHLEPQAFALTTTSGGATQPYLVLTSGIIERHMPGELKFVIGHELGHLAFHHGALGHGPNSAPEGDARLRWLARQRGAEISADRVGFVAVSDPADAFHALTKLGTGLDNRHVRLDLPALLRQFRELKSLGGNEYEASSTHPLFLCRLRALLWFEMSEPYQRWLGRPRADALTAAAVDARIQAELSALSGVDLATGTIKIVRQASLWAALLAFTEKGVLPRAHQEFLTTRFGESETRKAVAFGRDFGRDAVEKKLETALAEVARLPALERDQLHVFVESLGAAGRAVAARVRERVPRL